jgi:hypothetical protein
MGGNTHRQWKAVGSGLWIVASELIIRTTLFLNLPKFSPTSGVSVRYCQVGIVITHAGKSICILLYVLDVSKCNVSDRSEFTCARHKGLARISGGYPLTSLSLCSWGPVFLKKVSHMPGDVASQAHRKSWGYPLCVSGILLYARLLKGFRSSGRGPIKVQASCL